MLSPVQYERQHVDDPHGKCTFEVCVLESVPALRLTMCRCILLLEDLDAAFTRGISRDESSTGAPTSSSSGSSSSSSSSKNKDKDENNDGSTLSLSGLLNSLDGVAAAEGR